MSSAPLTLSVPEHRTANSLRIGALVVGLLVRAVGISLGIAALVVTSALALS
jgi:hypothetical protein